MTLKPLFDQFAQLNWLEVVGFVTGIWGVWLAGREKIWTWPVGLVNVIVSAFIFYTARLYADVGLQGFYFILTLYGWNEWHSGTDRHAPLPVVRAGWKLLAFIIVSGLAMSATAGYIIDLKLPDAAFPYLDSVAAVFGMLTTLLMARKVLQCWYLWVVVDLLSAWIYWQKGLYLYSLLYLVFCVQAVYAYTIWRRSFHQHQLEPGE